MAPFWMMNVIENNRALKSIYECDFMVPSNENLFYRYVQEGSKSVVRHTHNLEDWAMILKGKFALKAVDL